MAAADPNRWPSPAKLNLYLLVTGRKPDGYHELDTCFQLLDWGDEISIQPTDHQAIKRLCDLEGVPEEHDLSIRAARLLKKETAYAGGANISLHKQIPMGSGMGGASSNAATVLLVLNKLWKTGLGLDELATLGLQLGADVPVFIRGHSALARGVGEALTPVTLGDRHYVLLMPELGLSTARVFASPELKRDSNPAAGASAEDFGSLGNDCADVVLSMVPELAKMISELAVHGQWRMTGTGSTFFLETESKIHAEQLTNALKNLYNVRAARGVDRSVLFDRLDLPVLG